MFPWGVEANIDVLGIQSTNHETMTEEGKKRRRWKITGPIMTRNTIENKGCVAHGPKREQNNSKPGQFW